MIYSNKTIAKNTMFLYCRLLVGLAISFYTTRIVLDALGVLDYGIKNAVGGIVTLFQFLNGSLATSTQRFLSFDLGRGDYKMMNASFNIAMYIHIVAALVIICVTETVGLMLIFHEMVIPTDRLTAALWVFQTSMVALFFNLTQKPYSACLYAHEKLDIYAYLGIIDTIFKLIIALLIKYTSADRLILFSILSAIESILICFLYRWYCVRHFHEARLRLVWVKSRGKEMFKFAGWNLANQMAQTGRTSGVNILINIFFGPSINAARGIALSVHSAITGFAVAFINSLNPQITKSYASGDIIRMHNLLVYGSKYTFFLFFVFTLPITLEANYLLSLWLKKIPVMAVQFCQLSLIYAMVEVVSLPVENGVLATGRIRIYQIIMSGLLFLIPFFSYILYKNGYNPYTYLYIEIIISVISIFLRPYILRGITGMGLKLFLKKCVIKEICVVFLVVPMPLLSITYISSSFFRVILTTIITFLCSIAAIWIVGINSAERKSVIYYVKNLYGSYISRKLYNL